MKNVEKVFAISNEKLPEGWTFATIPELVGQNGVFVDGDWVESKDQDPNGEVRLIQLADIGDGYYRNKSARFLTHKKAVELNCTFIEAGDVLIARMPDPLGRACIFPGDVKKAVTVVDVAVVRSANHSFSHKWLMHFVNAPQFRSAVASMQSGSTRKRISRKNLARIVMPVPPRDQQEFLVAEIEKQFSRLDEGVNNLKRVKANLKRYKAAVLKAAVEGRLVETEAEIARREGRDFETGEQLLQRILHERRRKWEEAELAKMQAKGKVPKNDKWKQKYKEPAAPDTTNLPELPEGWVWATIEQLSLLVEYGSSARANANPNGVPVLRMGNIIDGDLRFDGLKYLPANHGEFPRLLLEAGDLLFNRTNSPELVGKTAVYEGALGKCSFASYLIRVRLLEGVSPKLISTYINSSYGRKWVKSVVTQQVGQANVNGTKLKALMVPLPPESEQHRIVAEVDRRLSILRETEAQVEASLQRAERLRQSILAAAFSGRLVTDGKRESAA